MGIQIRWFDDKQDKVHIIFENNWTLDDFQSMVLAASDMIQSQSHLVHVIADFTKSAIPSSTTLFGMPLAVRHIQPNQGAAIILSHNEVVNRLAKTAASIHKGLRHRVYVVNSLDIAERIMAHFGKQRRTKV